MLYIERIPTKRLAFLLAGLIPILYFVNLGVMELHRSEALLGTFAVEMCETGEFLDTKAHGIHIDSFPMYPWLVAACSTFRFPNEWTVRLPAVLSVVAMAGLAAWVARAEGGRLAGTVAAAMVLTNLACLRIGIRAQSTTVMAAFLSGAWFAWYRLGQDGKHWTRAWLVTMVFLLGAVLTSGAVALGAFYLPFLFMRKKVKGIRRMLHPAHPVVLILLGLVLALWWSANPDQPFMPWSVLRSASGQTRNYFIDRLQFPFRCAVYLMPWTFLAWTPFCERYQRLELRLAKGSVLFHYLRSICVSVFLVAWLTPRFKPLSLLPLLPALAVMTGLHFEILVRRHKRQLEILIKVLADFTLCGSVAVFAISVMHVIGFVRLLGLPLRTVLVSTCCVAVGGVAARWLRRERPNEAAPYWLRLVLAVAAVRLLIAGTVLPLRSWVADECRDAGRVLAGMATPEVEETRRYVAPVVLPPEPAPTVPTPDTLPAGTPPRPEPLAPETKAVPAHTVYRNTTDYFIRETFYMRKRFLAARVPERDLPPEEPVVYVLSGAKPPILTSRKWTPCSPPVDASEKNHWQIEWLPGGARLATVRVVPSVKPPNYEPIILRMYRGELR